MTIYYILTIAVALAVAGIFLVVRKFANGKLDLAFKITAIVLAVVYFFRYFLGKELLWDVVHFQGEGFQSKFQAGFSLALVWLLTGGELLAITVPFFRSKTANSLLSTYGLVAFLLTFAFGQNLVQGICATQTPLDARVYLLAVEVGVGLAISIITLFNNDDLVQMNKPDWIWYAVAVVGVIIATMPVYTLQVVMQEIAIHPDEFNLHHRIYIYPAFIIPIVLYLILKDKDMETKRFVLLFYALTQMISFCGNTRFESFANGGWVTSLPLHLCNTALFITPLCLMFRWKKVFYFTYFINVLGAFLAMAMPNYNDATVLFEVKAVEFFTSHYHAFFMPLLVVGVGIFPRPRLKEFKYSLVGFTIYFVSMLILNAWFSNYNPGVNYFFLNDNFIAEKLGAWAENLRNITWEFDLGSLHFKFYPIYQILFLIVYGVAALGMWFVYELCYDVVKGWQDIADKNKKIKADQLALEVALAGRDIKEPINMDGANKLILKNFTKRYSTSAVYAVKDANLEVCGGDIFGFLGPNGAGKSTIIKSIVGIQAITEGAIEVCGYDVQSQSVEAKRNIGFVPDHYALYERLTAREYINYIADLYGVTKADREERLNRFIKLFEFESAIDTPIKTYSHGMKQKVTIMSALIHNPKVWILDEPLTGLDPNSIFQVKECMKQHAKEGNIVFFSSHIIDVVERICNKIAIIKKGQIQCVRELAEMEKNGESLEQFYMSVINDTQVEAIAVEPQTQHKAKVVK